MTDREKIASPDYIEVLSDYIQPEGVEEPIKDYVYQRIDTDLGITYINEKELSPLGIREFTYRTIPKVYGLMQGEAGVGTAFDPTPLMQSGILQVQGEPLNLTGRGVVIGFLDTGERVIIWLSRLNTGRHRYYSCSSSGKPSGSKKRSFPG